LRASSSSLDLEIRYLEAMSYTTSLSASILALGLSLLGAACGGSGNDAATGSSSGAGGEASSTSSTATTATGTGGHGQGGSGTTGAGGSGTTSTGTGTGGAAAGGITPKLESASLGVNCQPVVAPDPIVGSFTAKYTNSSALPLSATISSAKLVFGTSPNTLSWPFTVSPASGGPVQPGSTFTVEHTKLKAPDGSHEGSPCDYCNSTWTLTVTWDLGGGKTATDTLPAEKVGCFF
jgi:hypothetical protein